MHDLYQFGLRQRLLHRAGVRVDTLRFYETKLGAARIRLHLVTLALGVHLLANLIRLLATGRKFLLQKTTRVKALLIRQQVVVALPMVALIVQFPDELVLLLPIDIMLMYCRRYELRRRLLLLRSLLLQNLHLLVLLSNCRRQSVHVARVLRDILLRACSTQGTRRLNLRRLRKHKLQWCHVAGAIGNLLHGRLRPRSRATLGHCARQHLHMELRA